jgi:DNA-binding transcriptional ArsR family regulator
MGKKKQRKKKNAAAVSAAARDERVFKALANQDRRRILDLVRESPLTVGQICDSIENLDRCTVMLHLKTLEAADLIIAKKEGRFRWNYLNIEPIQRIYNRWIKDFAQPAADLLVQLKDQIESAKQ